MGRNGHGSTPRFAHRDMTRNQQDQSQSPGAAGRVKTAAKRQAQPSSRRLHAASATGPGANEQTHAAAHTARRQQPSALSSGQRENRQRLPVSTFPRHGMGSPPVHTFSDPHLRLGDKTPSHRITRMG
jgi:hypothetical protein